jgi:hypothetical protein
MHTGVIFTTRFTYFLLFQVSPCEISQVSNFGRFYRKRRRQRRRETQNVEGNFSHITCKSALISSLCTAITCCSCSSRALHRLLPSLLCSRPAHAARSTALQQCREHAARAAGRCISQPGREVLMFSAGSHAASTRQLSHCTLCLLYQVCHANMCRWTPGCEH